MNPTTPHPRSAFLSRIRLAVSVFCLVLVCPAALLAQAPSLTADPTYGAWRSGKIGGGGYLGRVIQAPSRPDTLYTYIDVAGCFRSDDAGRSWRMLHGSLPARYGNYHMRDLTVDPRDENTVMVAVGTQWAATEGIYRTTDGGVTWTKVLSSQFYGNETFRWAGLAFARHPADPDTLYVASAGTGLWRSTDNGLTWNKLGLEGIFPTDIRLDPADPQRIWVCSAPFTPYESAPLRGGFFRSDDAGVTWQTLLEGPSLPIEILPDPATPSALLGLFDCVELKRSLDAGVTWEDFGQGLPIDPASATTDWSESRFNALARTPTHWLTASANGTFYRRGFTDAAWEKLPAPRIEEGDWFGRITPGEWTHFGKALGSIVVDSRDPQRWWFTDWYAIYETTDAGQSWTLRIDGIEATVLHCIAQDPADPGAVLIGMADCGAFYSEDGGRRYKKPTTYLNNVKSIAFSPALPARIYATGNHQGKWQSDQVFVSLDRGRNWDISPLRGLPSADRRANTIVVSSLDPYRLYLGVAGPVGPDAGGVYTSADGGARWTWLGDGLPAGQGFFQSDIWSIGTELATGPGGEVLALSRALGVVYAFDGQGGWRATAPLGIKSPHSLVADPVTPGRYYVGTPEALLATDDAGRTWKRIREGSSLHVAVDQARPERLAAGTADGIVLSEDAGRTWRDLDRGLPNRVNNLVAFAGDRLIAGSMGNGVFWLPLTPGAADPISARPLPAAALPPSSGPLPKLINLDPAAITFSEKSPTPAWSVWVASGRLVAAVDTAPENGARPALKLTATEGRADGTFYQSFKAVETPFIISGSVQADSVGMEECMLALQIYDARGTQIDWITLSNPPADGTWSDFTVAVQLPQGAARASLVLRYIGSGTARIGRMTVSAAPSIYLTASDAP